MVALYKRNYGIDTRNLLLLPLLINVWRYVPNFLLGAFTLAVLFRYSLTHQLSLRQGSLPNILTGNTPLWEVFIVYHVKNQMSIIKIIQQKLVNVGKLESFSMFTPYKGMIPKIFKKDWFNKCRTITKKITAKIIKIIWTATETRRITNQEWIKARSKKKKRPFISTRRKNARWIITGLLWRWVLFSW